MKNSINNTTYANLPMFSLDSVIRSLSPNMDSYNKATPLVITVFGFFGMNNIGDDAILHTELEQLKSLKVPIRVNVPTRYPDRITRDYAVKAFRFGNILALFLAIKRSHIVIIGGGGLFCNPWRNSSMRNKVADFLFTCYKTFFFLILPMLLRKLILVGGIGYYDNQTKVAKKITSFGLRYATYISVRDRHSYDLLRKLLPDKKVHFTKDVVFSMKVPPKIMVKPAISERKELKNIAISLVNVNDKYLMAKIVQSIADIMNNMHEKYIYFYFPF